MEKVRKKILQRKCKNIPRNTEKSKKEVNEVKIKKDKPT